MKPILSILALLFTLSTLFMSAQKGRPGHHPHGRHPHAHPKKVVVVKRSPYRPAKVVVYHPYWRPKYEFHRRWVFFPRYNLYWDNWRNHYYFYNGKVWISQSEAPPSIAGVDLEKEKSYELKEDEDDTDDIATANEQHKTEYTYK